MTNWNFELPPVRPGDVGSAPLATAAPTYGSSAPGFQQQLEEARRRPEPRDDAQRRSDDAPAARSSPPATRSSSSDDADSRERSPDEVESRSAATSTPSDAAAPLASAAPAKTTADSPAEEDANVAGTARGARKTSTAKDRHGLTANASPNGKHPVVAANATEATNKTAADSLEAAASGRIPGEENGKIVSPTADGATLDKIGADRDAALIATVDGLSTATNSNDAATAGVVATAAATRTKFAKEPQQRSDQVADAVASSLKHDAAADSAVGVSGTSAAATTIRSAPAESRSTPKRAGGGGSTDKNAASSEPKQTKSDLPVTPTPAIESTDKRPATNATPPNDAKSSASDEFCRALPAPSEGTASGGLKPPAIQLGPRSAPDEVGGTGVLTAADRARFLQRVTRAIHAAVDGGGQMKLRLSPPELGSLKLEVTLQDGALSARFEAETPQARTLLIESMPALRERLSEQNITLDRYEVDLMQQPSDQKEQFARPDRDDRETRFDGNRRTTNKPTIATDATTPRRPGVMGADGRLNVVI